MTVILLIFLCLESLLFFTFTAVMFGTQIHSICNDETVRFLLWRACLTWLEEVGSPRVDSRCGRTNGEIDRAVSIGFSRLSVFVLPVFMCGANSSLSLM